MRVGPIGSARVSTITPRPLLLLAAVAAVLVVSEAQVFGFVNETTSNASAGAHCTFACHAFTWYVARPETDEAASLRAWSCRANVSPS